MLGVVQHDDVVESVAGLAECAWSRNNRKHGRRRMRRSSDPPARRDHAEGDLIGKEYRLEGLLDRRVKPTVGLPWLLKGAFHGSVAFASIHERVLHGHVSSESDGPWLINGYVLFDSDEQRQLATGRAVNFVW